ncbi:MAG: c-type cytochrome [Candidatus Methylomirabilales bacterium]
MKLYAVIGASVALLAGATLSTGDDPGHSAPDPGTLRVGRLVFEQNCAVCHGALGDGRGMAGMMVRTKPRDFRPGVFKFRSTPTGSLPTDDDLFQTITRGLRGTGMVSQGDLPERERRAVVEYLKTFSERFRAERAQAPVPIPEVPPRTPKLVSKGREVYHKAECFKCHGTQGRGDGPSATDLKDDWGYPIQPSDLTRPLKRGSTPEAIYRTVVTGLDGTPMPSYEGALTDEDMWALASYVASLNTGVLSERQRREEGAGEMVLRMHGGRGGGMMRRMPMMRDMCMM